VVLSLAVIPLMLSWRVAAILLCDQAYPRGVATTSDNETARERIMTAFNLNGSLFTPPVTVSALLAPLVTSFLAIFVPQISS